MERFSNQARVTYSYEGTEQTYTNDSNIVSSSIRDEHSVSVEKTSTSSNFRAGDTITYMVEITNNGCECLSHFDVVDEVENSEYLRYIVGSARLYVNGSMHTISPSDTTPLTFDIDERLERDESIILQYNMLVSDNISAEISELTDTVTVRAYPCGCGCGCGCDDHSHGAVEDSDTLTIPRSEFAEVLITKAISNENLCCGEEFDYYITLTNTGTIDATNVVVTDQLPAEFVVTDIYSENNGESYRYDEREYDIDDANFLTLPNESGTIIEVPAVAPGVDNSTVIRIHGHM